MKHLGARVRSCQVKILPGQSHDFPTPSHLSATRFWPKMGCDESGHNCRLASQNFYGQQLQQPGCLGCHGMSIYEFWIILVHTQLNHPKKGLYCEMFTIINYDLIY